MIAVSRQRLLTFLESFPVLGSHLKRYRQYKAIPHDPGHYYSVIPDLEEVARCKDRVYNQQKIEGIDLYEEQQLLLLRQLVPFYKEIPYDFATHQTVGAGTLRYRSRDAFYRNSDAILLYGILRHYKPQRIVEIGSGHSSALMLDTAEHHLPHTTMTFIEPFPEERLLPVLKPGDKNKATVVKQYVQEADAASYLSLEENDILFVDSSHVSKIGSDVNFIMFDILPRLKAGVIIHLHDIFFPFELPEKWVTGRKWFWNENYLLRAFLMNNPDYRILLFNDLMHKRHRAWFEAHMPQCLIDAENTGSIWIVKVR